MANFISPDQIPLRYPGSKQLSSSEMNGLIFSSRRVTQNPYQYNDYIMKKIEQYRSIFLEVEEDIPIFSIFSIQADSVSFEKGTPTGKTDKIEYNTMTKVLVTNGELPLYQYNSNYCKIINSYEPCLLTFDIEDGVPEINTQIGPKDGSYKVTVNGAGLLVVSPPDENNHIVWCIREYGPMLKVGYLDEQLEHDGHATVSVYVWDGDEWIDSGDEEEGYDWLLAEGQVVEQGKKVIIQKHYNGIWVVTEAECP